MLRPGMAVELMVDAFPSRSFSAMVLALDSRIDIDSRNILVRARLNDHEGLLPGMFARVRVELSTPERVLSVPETAVSYSVNGNILYLLQESEGAGEAPTVESVVVRTGQEHQGRVAVYGEIQAGNRIVTSGQNKLYRGARIAIDDSMEF